LLQTLKKYITEYKITIIVVGLPYDLHGKNIKQLNKTKEYIKYLQSEFPEIMIE
jgi:RNase H-fold protein (predicted Holliday junction resolvase)